MTLVHFVTSSEKSPLALLCQRGDKTPPFAKGAARSAGGFLSALCPSRVVRLSHPFSLTAEEDITP
jgi:hypothetical protein